MRMRVPLAIASLACVCASVAAAPPAASCVSGRFHFDPTRIALAKNASLDRRLFDFIVDYSPQQTSFENGVATLRLTKDDSGGPAIGTRLSSTRLIHYGRITFGIEAIAVPGVITTAITMSDTGDEIDWEVVGSNHNQIQTCVFYNGIGEYGVHGVIHPVCDVRKEHTYTIDWKRDRLTWSIDDKVVRTLVKADSVSPMTPPGHHWYPQSPSRVQFAVWDGGSTPATSYWSGGPIPWGNNTFFEAKYTYIDVQCYNSSDMPVPKWPDDASNPPRVVPPAPSSSPVSVPSTNPAPAHKSSPAKNKETCAPKSANSQYETAPPVDTTIDSETTVVDTVPPTRSKNVPSAAKPSSMARSIGIGFLSITTSAFMTYTTTTLFVFIL